LEPDDLTQRTKQDVREDEEKAAEERLGEDFSERLLLDFFFYTRLQPND